MKIWYYDAHNHLQDERLRPSWDDVVRGLDEAGVVRMVVNGTQESDWERVRQLAAEDERVIPSYGLHPWNAGGRSVPWRDRLRALWDERPDAAVGEIGLDRWIEGYDLADQEVVFLWQWREAVRRRRAVSVHCLRAWGKLTEILRKEPLPEKGFLLHSYSGSAELIKPLAEAGAYFSVSGYFGHSSKRRKLEVFREVPPDRLLIETDAPDMALAKGTGAYDLGCDASGRPINHPANLPAVYRMTAELLAESLDSLAERVAENFQRLFSG